MSQQATVQLATRRANPVRRRHRAWQIIIRIAVALVMLTIAGYLTLPWWVPTNWVRRMVLQNLAAQTHREVAAGELSLSWSEGLVLQDLVVASPEGFGGEPMLRVGRVSCSLSPLDLLGGRIEWVEVTRPHLTIVVDEDGLTNLDGLGDITWDVEPQRCSVHDARVDICLPGQDTPMRLDVRDFQQVKGPDGQLGIASLTGILHQRQGPARVGLHFRGRRDQQPAKASLQFAGLQLEELSSCLPDMGRLQGQAGGALSFNLNRHGQIEQLEIDLHAQDLQITAANGQSLPKLDRAGVRVSADYDTFSDRIDIRTAEIHLPGVDLRANGSIYRDFLLGRWDALHSLRLKGTITPKIVEALLVNSVPNEPAMRCDGDLAIVASLQRANPADRLDMDVSLDATDIKIRWLSTILKSKGTPAGMHLVAAIDGRHQGMDLKQFSLNLGRNQLTAEMGQFDQLGKLLKQLNAPQSMPTVRQWMDALSNSSVRGTVLFCDATSLAKACGMGAEEIGMAGEMRGTWSLNPGTPGWLRVGLETPANQILKIGQLLDKPAAEPLQMELTAAIDHEHNALEQVQFTTSYGRSSLSLRDGRLQWNDTAEGPVSEFKGKLRLESLEDFVAIMPAVCDASGPMLRGNMSGTMATVHENEQDGIRMEMDATGLVIRLGDVLTKPATEPMQINASLMSRGLGCSPQSTLVATMDGLSLACKSSGNDQASLAIDLPDLSQLTRFSPAFQQLLDGGYAEGRARIEAEYEDMFGRRVSIKARADDVSIGHGHDRQAIRMEDVSTALSGRLVWDDREIWQIDNVQLQMQAADSHVDINGEMSFNPEQVGSRDWLAGITSADCTLHGEVAPAKIIDALLPSIRQQTKALALSGRSQLQGALTVKNSGASLTMTVDGKDLAVDSPQLSKPAGLSAEASLKLFCPREDPFALNVSDLQARVGKVWLRANGAMHTRTLGGTLDATLQVGDASELLHRMPRLIEDGWSEMSGSAEVSASWRGQARGLGRIEAMTVEADALGGRFRGKNVTLSGTVRLDDLGENMSGSSMLGRIRTDDLEFHVGGTHGWLVADVGELLHSPKGQAHVLFATLDDLELIRWLSPAEPGDIGTLSGEALVDLEIRADRWVDILGERLQNADLSLRISADQYRAYDKSVDQQYDVQDLHLQALAKQGRLSLVYDAGLNGGTLHQRMETRLSQAVPVVHRETRINEIQATEAIRPQISNTFPGNTVYGLFSREEDVTFPLQAMIANAFDARYRVVTVGRATMVATDGVVVGRSAPHFVARIFPGLNLTEYAYDRMTGFTTFLPDGSAENETLFSGLYDVYMEGVTALDQQIRYTVGVVLVPTSVSPQWHRDWKQGRFPILKVKGLIRDGQLVNDEVSYPWPNETLFEIFLQNNIVYRAWVNYRNDKAAAALP